MSIIFVLAVLVLFALASLLPGEDPRSGRDPRDDMHFWIRYGIH